MKTSSSTRWLARQQRDPYVKQAQLKNYRSRAWFKLEEISKKFELFPFLGYVFDLGSAPGGWSQFLSMHVPKTSSILACDVLPMAPLPNVQFVQGDFLSEEILQYFYTHVHCNAISVSTILSDMAPNLTGQRWIDAAQSLELAENVWQFASQILSMGGVCVIKGFQSVEFEQFAFTLRPHFKQLLFYKPRSSRGESKETYLVALGYKEALLKRRE